MSSIGGFAANKGGGAEQRADGTCRVLSVNVGGVRPIIVRGQEVPSSIFKHPVSSAEVAERGLIGDARVEPRKMGEKAHALSVYCSANYAAWSRTLQVPLHWGQFGENLTLSGHLETVARIGDVLRIGDVVAQITQPREPCRKLDARMGFKFSRRFLESRKVGYYLRVLQTGRVAPGDEVTLLETNSIAPTVDEFVRVVYFDYWDWLGLEELLRAPELPSGWREVIGAKLRRAKSSGGWFGLRPLLIRQVERGSNFVSVELTCPRGRELPPVADGQELPVAFGDDVRQRITRVAFRITRASSSCYCICASGEGGSQREARAGSQWPDELVAGTTIMARAPRQRESGHGDRRRLVAADRRG